jgi:hypothetical protein
MSYRSKGRPETAVVLVVLNLIYKSSLLLLGIPCIA